MQAPFRGTFRGTVADLQNLDTTQQGQAKRVFKLVDATGAYLECCALGHNAYSTALTDLQDVVVYYATGRSPIGSSPGRLYLMKDSVILSLGVCAAPAVVNTSVDIL